MRQHRSAPIAVLLWSLLGCAAIQPGPQGVEGLPKQGKARQIIVTLAEDTPERWAAVSRALGAEHGVAQVGEFPLRSIRVQCLVYQVPDGLSYDAVLARLRADPRVDSAQSNLVFEGLLAAHSDPYAGLQHGAQAIGADRVHGSSTGRGIRVAVIDTGADRSHPDLRGRIVATANFVEGGESSFARDPHGTAVAGVIAARADDDVGIYGVAPEAEVLALKACWYPEDGAERALCSSWTIAKAVDHAINAQARVLNFSLAGPPDPLLARLVEAAVARGVVPVAAAAGPEDPGYPAALPGVIPVIASDVEGRVADGTAGAGVAFVAAPGAEILTTAPREGYDFLSGSSLATAHVAGVVALVLEGRPWLKPTEVHALLRETTRSSAAAGTIGIVDACAALCQVTGGPACP
ncbi:MAG: S8 family peptidase [Gammaproteobacteria bacterium]